jgi:hypothetical protein
MKKNALKLGSKVDVVTFCSEDGGVIKHGTATIVGETATHWRDGKGRRYTKSTGKLSDGMHGAGFAQYAVAAGTARSLTMSPGRRAALKAWDTMRAAA